MTLKQRIQLYNLYSNPLYHWWKARKVFKFPNVHFIFGKDVFFYGMYVNKDFYNRIFSIVSVGLGYKTKYNDFRFEYDPFIEICFFRKFHFIIKFDYLCKKDKLSGFTNDSTWEAMLDYTSGLPIEECIKKHIWTNIKGDLYTINNNIKKKYRIKVK